MILNYKKISIDQTFLFFLIKRNKIQSIVDNLLLFFILFNYSKFYNKNNFVDLLLGKREINETYGLIINNFLTLFKI
jgi:hypothetical protein